MDLGAAAEGIGEAMRAVVFLGCFAVLLLGEMAASMDMILAENTSRTLVFIALALLVGSGGLLLVNEVAYRHLSPLPLVWWMLVAGVSLYISVACVRLLRGKSRLAQADTARPGNQRIV